MRTCKSLVLLAAIILLPLSAGDSSASTHSEKMTVSLGEEFSFTVETNPSTGFQWQLVKPIDETILRFVEKKYNAVGHPRLMGSWGKETWTFEAVKVGTTEIALEYCRSWEKGVSPARTKIYKIRVK
ncbi:MAG: protease inhibitor I42 family protein [Bdellovibrionales bacterium]